MRSDAAKFIAALGGKEEKYYNTVLASSNPAVNYLLRIAIWDEEDEVTIQLIYPTAPSDIQRKKARQGAPSIEEFGNWFRQFFKYDTTHVHMHAHFSYPLASRSSRFPLPLKTNIEDAEIDGVSLTLPSEPEGVGRIRITQGDEEWYVEVIADRRMTFKGFMPHPDVKALASMVNTFLEERK